MDTPPLRPLLWVGSSRKEYERFSDTLRHDLGYALYRVQIQRPVPNEKPLNKGALKGLGVA